LRLPSLRESGGGRVVNEVSKIHQWRYEMKFGYSSVLMGNQTSNDIQFLTSYPFPPETFTGTCISENIHTHHTVSRVYPGLLLLDLIFQPLNSLPDRYRINPCIDICNPARMMHFFQEGGVRKPRFFTCIAAASGAITSSEVL